MKNDITLEKYRIIKVFNSDECFNRELLIYKLNLPYVPDMLEYSRNVETGSLQNKEPENPDPFSLEGFQPEKPESEKKWIILNRINGHHPEPDSLDDFEKMLFTLIRFHRDLKNFSLSFSHNDPNPKNFIIEEDKCYLIDFSEISHREAEYDIIAFFLFAVDFLNIDDLKQLVDYYLSHFSFFYHINRSMMNQSVREFDERRKTYKNIHQLNPEQETKRKFIQSKIVNEQGE